MSAWAASLSTGGNIKENHTVTVSLRSLISLVKHPHRIKLMRCGCLWKQ